MDYLLPAGTDLGAARELLGAHLTLEGDRPVATSRTFYDTFDGLLHAKQLTLLHADGRLALVDVRTLAEHASITCPKRPGRVFAGQLQAGPLRDALAALTDVRALLPIARLTGKTQALRVLDGERKTVVRLAIDDVRLAGRSAGDGVLHGRLRVLPVRGYDKRLARVRATLEGKLGLAPAPWPLQDEAVTALGGQPGGVSSKLGIELVAGARADEATAMVLTRLLDIMRVNLPGTLADIDAEFLHDFRVAVRRTRSVQRQLNAVFAPEPLAHFRAEFRWLQQITGPTRDLDVHLEDIAALRAGLDPPLGDDLEPLHVVLAQRRRREQRRMTRMLRSARVTDLLDVWGEHVAGLVGLPQVNRPAADRPIEAVAGERIAKVYRRIVKTGSAIDATSPPEDLHELRKRGKELRYLLEFFGSLYSSDAVDPLVKSLKRLQDVLGRFQDRSVQIELLRSLQDDVAARDGGAAALLAMGVVIGRLEDDQHAARADFAQRFAAMASRERRAMVREAIG